MLLCENMADIQRAVAQMTQADYTSRVPALAAARDVAVGYMDIYARAAKTVLKAE